MPRFQIRTLMILVAVTAFFFWDGTAHAIFSLTFFIFGPSIGALWMGHRAHGRCIAFFQGAAAGALISSADLWRWGYATFIFVGPTNGRIGALPTTTFVSILVVYWSVTAFLTLILWILYRENQRAVALASREDQSLAKSKVTGKGVGA
jgi:hypothetical protein